MSEDEESERRLAKSPESAPDVTSESVQVDLPFYVQPPMPGDPSVAVSREYQGPVPHPQMLAEYDAVVPGSAKMLLDTYRSEVSHRQRCEVRELDFHDRRLETASGQMNKGRAAALLVSLGFLGAVILAIIEGHPTLAGILGTLDLASIIGVFMTGKSRRRERTRRSEDDKREDEDER